MVTRALRLLAAFVAAFCAVAVNAQPHSTYSPTLESMLAFGDTVFTGTISQYEQGSKIRVRVTHILKGSPPAGMVLDDPEPSLAWYWTSCARSRTELLWIGRSGYPSAQKSVWTALDLRDASRSGFYPGFPNFYPRFPSLPILGMDLKPIATRADLLRHARQFLAVARKDVRWIEIPIPWLVTRLSPGTGCLPAFANALYREASNAYPTTVENFLTLPIVSELRPVAKEMVENPEQFLGPPSAVPPEWHHMDPKVRHGWYETFRTTLVRSGQELLTLTAPG